jgi:hypothetical protein
MAESIDITQTHGDEDARELALYGLAQTASILADMLDRKMALVPDSVITAHEKEQMAFLWNEICSQANALRNKGNHLLGA